MSEKFDQVSKAIFEAEKSWWGAHAEPEFSLHDTLALAAINAMLEPTTQMLKAACAAMSPAKRPTPDRVGSKQKHKIRYQAMVAAALSPSQSETPVGTLGERL